MMLRAELPVQRNNTLYVGSVTSMGSASLENVALHQYIENNRCMKKPQALDALAALAHETRLDVFRLLVQAGPEGVPAGEVADRLRVLQNTMSTHLGVLARAGLIRREREGRVIRYSADFDGMQKLLTYLLQDCCRGNPSICAPLVDTIRCAC
jgi:ArsR family transcriptional regulator, arsenate/arsenite/antimonite-responsive transcriptional repressor